MKKTLAGVGVSALGLAGATVGVSPAMAADVTIPCVDWEEHVPAAGPLPDNWYMDCVPQYGLGKVEFSITSDIAFPAGFLPLTDPGVTTVATPADPTSVGAYFGPTTAPAGWATLQSGSSNGDLDTSTRQSYLGSMIFEISSVDDVPLADLEAVAPDCGLGTYTKAYVVNYLPTTVTFTQTVDGEVWTYDVIVTPGPLYLALNSSPVSDGDEAACASSSTGYLLGLSSAEPDWLNVIANHAFSTRVVGDFLGLPQTLSPFPSEFADAPAGFGGFRNLGEIARTSTVTPSALAPTGLAPELPLGIGALLIGLGLSAGWLRRRRTDQA